MDQVCIQFLDNKNVPGRYIDDKITYIDLAKLFLEQRREILNASYVQVLQHLMLFQFRVAETAAEELQKFLDRHNQDGAYDQIILIAGEPSNSWILSYKKNKIL
jgi:hypothetical protein